ncbi:unnamed protein product [Peronospora destructor]|uniref:HECT-type E3 ubiquitin transferase n=1 Tax=Peronospora destructor TaxID=86335 RepID=A0AAV0U8Q2_9STRA|nr:unnamed protein product [Peronospora destructor]
MACGFKNFVHVVQCAFCGLSSLDPDLPVTVRPIPDSLIDEKIPLPLAHKRREWTRQLDDQDRLVWRRRLVEKSDHLPGYVLRFALPVEAEPESESAVSSSKERSLSTGYDPSAGVQIELLEPYDVGPTQFPLPPPHADMVDMIDDMTQAVVVLAAQDFPTKYAYFVASAAMLLQDGDCSVESCLTVHRDYIFEQSIQHIRCIHEANIRSVRISVSFAGEGDVSSDDKGVGGLHREWLTLVNEKLMDPEVGLFSCTKCSDQTFFINPQSETTLGADHLQYFYAAGRLVGRALLEGAVLNFHLCAPLLKMMVGMPIAFGDLEYLDAEMYQNLTWLLDKDDAGTLELDFTVSQRHGNHVQIVELIPAGRNIQVNDDNKFEFADRKFRFMMFESLAPQLVSFLKGFYEVVPQRLLLAFDDEELDCLLCGSDKIDVSDWKRDTHLALESRR